MIRTIRLAVISTVYNERVFLPQFLDHYARQVDAVFLLDNESTDGSTGQLSAYRNVAVSRFSTGGKLDDGMMREVKIAKLRECVGRFDYVLLPDVDEFVIAKEGWHLREAISRFAGSEVLGTHGYNMFQHASELPYDPTVPLYHQRRFGIEDIEFYSKPIIVAPDCSVTFDAGFHRLLNRENSLLKHPENCHFHLLHYTGIDEDVFVERALSRSRRISEGNFRNGWGHHYFNGTEQVFRERFRTASALSRRVPAAWQNAPRSVGNTLS